MPEKSRRNKGYRQKGTEDSLAPADAHLWQSYTRDIVPLEDGGACDLPVSGIKTPQENTPGKGGRAAPGPQSPAAKPAQVAQAAELDFRTEQKLRRGRMEIDGTLDLHGMTQARAHGALNDFVTQAHRRGARCLLVITGKGRGGHTDAPQGILKQKLPDWLSQPPVAGIILKITQAQPRHGGGGAFYVYLRRQRN